MTSKYQSNRKMKTTMLNVYFGNMESAISDPSMFFRNQYQDAWLSDPMTETMAHDIDGATILPCGAIRDRYSDMISARELSRELQTLILIRFRPDMVFNASFCGNDCAKWILQIGKCNDITINLRHPMHFGQDGFSIKVLNSGNVVHDSLGFLTEYDRAMRAQYEMIYEESTPTDPTQVRGGEAADRPAHSGHSVDEDTYALVMHIHGKASENQLHIVHDEGIENGILHGSETDVIERINRLIDTNWSHMPDANKPTITKASAGHLHGMISNDNLTCSIIAFRIDED